MKRKRTVSSTLKKRAKDQKQQEREKKKKKKKTTTTKSRSIGFVIGFVKGAGITSILNHQSLLDSSSPEARSS